MSQTIARRLARTVLEDVLESDGVYGSLNDAAKVDPERAIAAAVDRLMVAAVVVRRAKTRDHGEVVSFMFVVEPDKTDETLDESPRAVDDV